LSQVLRAGDELLALPARLAVRFLEERLQRLHGRRVTARDRLVPLQRLARHGVLHRSQLAPLGLSLKLQMPLLAALPRKSTSVKVPFHSSDSPVPG